ncbi:S8 family peptidase [Goodfellowiella coeruleoviolacea]|uniref:Subtilase family protein n=1 Tax=Goodfellowiella coeruleoviolacea TaxID=334858 RepID=A0AAE3GD00_9PSEU|nr:S8 family serine peptidase [Goodfellowiella coeruleoviolacea]MCP2165114.1 Subtilase family protein [Goodfellowiella coeruleoviolacea]
MPLFRRVRAVAVSAALLTTGCLTIAPLAGADPAGEFSPECRQPGPVLRYLVVFDRGTSEQTATGDILAACGTTTVYYPQIAVAVATSPDPDFLRRIGPDRAYSAQAEAVSSRTGTATRRKVDEVETNQRTARGTTGPAPDRTAEQWNMAMIRADEAHKITLGSRSVVVGVLDSGVDADHPDLAGALDPTLSAGCLTGRPNSSPSAWTATTSPHGTHVAGIIAAADDGHGITGVAPGVRIASVKVVDDDGYIYPEYAVCGFMWAASTGMSITNSSYYIDPWVFTCAEQPGQAVVYEAVRRAVDYAAARGVLSVAAATNGGVDLSNPGKDTRSPDNAPAGKQRPRSLDSSCAVLPGQLRNVVAVSSVGAQRLKAGYSSYGLGAVDIAAAGGDRRQQPDGPGRSCVLSTVPDGGYDYSCGTSMAAPQVSGVAALLASTYPGASPSQLRRLLNNQASTIACPADYDLNGTGVQDAFCTGYSGYNSFYGHGLVDALAAVTVP